MRLPHGDLTKLRKTGHSTGTLSRERELSAVLRRSPTLRAFSQETVCCWVRGSRTKINNSDPIHKTRITTFFKPVASEEVTEEETVAKRLTLVCNAVSGYLASRFNNANMELLKGLDGLDENSPDWLSFQKLRLCWKWSA